MKSFLKVVLGLLITAGLVTGIVYGVKQHNDSKLVAKVAPVSNLTYYYWGDDLESYGYITSDEAQNVYLNSSEKVKTVYVEEGDTVAVGDPLLAYDVSDNEISIAQKQLSIEQTQNLIQQANAALAKLQTDGNSKTQTADSQVTTITELKKSLKNAQAELKTWNNTKSQEDADKEYQAALKKYEDLPEVKKYNEDYAAYVIALKAYNDAWDTYRAGHEAYLQDPTHNTDPTVPGLTEPQEPTLTLPDGVSTPEESYYPSDSEISSMIKMYKEEIASLQDEIWMAEFTLENSIESQKQKIKELDIDLRRQQMELAQLQSADNDGIVRAKVAGTVKNLQDIDNLPNDGSAFLTVSASDGLYVKGQISELNLADIAPGTIVSGFTWASGMNFTATIQSIDDTPLKDSYYSDSSVASTYYYTAYIEDATGLQNGEDAQLTISTSGDEGAENAIYLQKMYLRKKDGETYVMKRAEDGTLVKQLVTTGKTIYGSAVEVTSGLSQEDYIAFPYGKTAKEGVATEIVDYID